jgi:hypothetical protein
MGGRRYREKVDEESEESAMIAMQFFRKTKITLSSVI